MSADALAGTVLGIDVGGTKVAAARLSDGQLGLSDVAPSAKGSAESLIEQLVATVEAHRGHGLAAVGIGVPSVVEFTTGRVRSTVNLPLQDVPLRALLEERTGLPVYVENDASCAALAEAFQDGELVCPDLVMFTVGTGVGGGLVLGGRLYRGATGGAAEVGHTMIGLDLTDGAPEHPGLFPQPGSLEVLASGRSLDALGRDAAGRRPEGGLGRRLAEQGHVGGADVVELAREGDPDALRALEILGGRLGIGIANAVNWFDPLEVVVGGGVSTAGELLLGPAKAAAARHTLPGVGTRTTIRLARHGPQAGVLGAALNAAQVVALDRAAGSEEAVG